MQKKSIILLGATGLVGGACLKRLLEDDYWDKIITFTRIPLAQSAPKLISHIIDFDKPDTYQSLTVADCLVCCFGTTIKKAGAKEAFYKVDFTYSYEIAKAALKNGTEQLLLVTALGANPKSLFFYNRTKGEIEQAVLNLGYKSVCIFRPSLLTGERKEFRLGEEIGKFLSNLFYFLIPNSYKPTPVDILADAIIKEAKRNHQGHRIIESHEIIAGK